MSFLLLVGALQAADNTNTQSRGLIQRQGKPDCWPIADDDRAMAEAVQSARKTLNKFIDAVRSPKKSQSRFAIKKPFIEGDKVEHLWVNEVTFDGKVFHGKVDNEPVDLKAVRLGDEVTVKPEEISDWMYVQNGRLVGAYTTRCVCRGMSAEQKKQFEKDIGCRMD